MSVRVSTLAVVFSALLAGLVWVDSSSALVPNGVTQQGRLVDSDGEPVSGEVLMVFTVYNDAAASEPDNVLWSESLQVLLDEGYFSVRLGEDGDNPFPPSVFNGSVRFLGVKVGTDDEMVPRERVGSVPYAFMANDVVGDIHPTSVTVAGNEIINSSGAWVGAIPDRNNSTLLSMVTGTAGSAAGLQTRSVTCPGGTSATGGGCNFSSGGAAVSGYLKASYPTVSAGRPNGWSCRAQGAQSDGSATADGTVTPYAVCLAD